MATIRLVNQASKVQYGSADSPEADNAAGGLVLSLASCQDCTMDGLRFVYVA